MPIFDLRTVRKYLHPRNRAKRFATIELTLRGQKGVLLPYPSFAARRYYVLFCSLKFFDGNGSDAARFRSLIVLLTREIHAWQHAAGGFQPSPSRDRRYWRVQSVPSSLHRWARPLTADRALVHRAARRLGHQASIPRATMSRSPEALAFGSRRYFILASLSLPLCGCLLNRSSLTGVGTSRINLMSLSHQGVSIRTCLGCQSHPAIALLFEVGIPPHDDIREEVAGPSRERSHAAK
jgi:hypothetical protein